MPAHFEFFGTDRDFAFEVPFFPETAEKAVVIPGLGLTLRRLNLDKTKYDPTGKYYETVVTLPNWKAAGLDSFFAFDAVEILDPDVSIVLPATPAKIGYQLSNDNGVIWYAWVDGPDAWLPAGIGGPWNDLRTVDKRIPLFPFGPGERQLDIRVRLTPGSSGRQRPVLKLTTVFNSHHMDIMEDVARSLKRYIDGAVMVPMFFNAELVPAAGSITIPVEPGLDVTISAPIRVYNLTTDPGRNINLFSSLAGRTVTLTGPTLGTVEVQFTGVPDVFIGAEEFFQISKIPSIVVFVNSMEQYTVIRSWAPETERSLARFEGRLQDARLFYMIYISVKSQSPLKREAMQMIDALSRILDKSQCFLSVASGECYCIMDQESKVTEDRIAEGLFVCSINLKVLGKVWEKGLVENESNLTVDDHVIPLIKEVSVLVGAENSCNLNLPKHLRGTYREETKIDDSE